MSGGGSKKKGEVALPTLLVLKSEPNGLKAAEQYLVGKGWEIQSAFSLKDALKFIIQRQPQYFLVPADYSHSKVRLLPKLLPQVFPIYVVGYVESFSVSSKSHLNLLDTPYKLQPPVSGPVIESLISKLQRQDKSANPNLLAQGGSLLSKGFVFTRRDPQALGEDLSTVVSQKEVGGQASASALLLPSKGGGSGTEVEAKEALRQLLILGEEENIEKEKGDTSPTQSPKAPVSKESLVFQATKFTLEETIFVKGKPENRESRVDKSSKLRTSDCSLCFSFRQGDLSGYLVLVNDMKPSSVKLFISRIQNIFLRHWKDLGGSGAGDQGIKGHFFPTEVQLKEVPFGPWALTKADFFQSFHGDQEREIAAAFFTTDRAKDTFEEVSLKGIKGVKGVKGDEDGFEGGDGIEGEAGEGGHKRMLKVPLEEVYGDTNMDFDLYLYLPTNGKLVLYVRNGKRFSERQKNSLRGRGVDCVYVKREAMDKVRKHRAQSFLNDKIKEFLSAPPGKPR